MHSNKLVLAYDTKPIEKDTDLAIDSSSHSLNLLVVVEDQLDHHQSDCLFLQRIHAQFKLHEAPRYELQKASETQPPFEAGPMPRVTPAPAERDAPVSRDDV